MTHILITRPKPESSLFAQELTELGYPCLVEPVLECRPYPGALPDFNMYQGLIITSPAAARILSKHKQSVSLPLYCVGEKTASLCRDIGFKNIPIIADRVDSLIDKILQTIGPQTQQKLLYLSGYHQTMDLASELEKFQIPCDTHILYEMAASASLSDKTLQAFEDTIITVMPFFSARTYQTFLSLAEQHNITHHLRSINALFLSQTMLLSHDSTIWKNAHSADSPTQIAIIERIKSMMPKEG